MLPIYLLFFSCCQPLYILLFFFLMIRRPPRSTLDRSSAASDVYKRQGHRGGGPARHSRPRRGRGVARHPALRSPLGPAAAGGGGVLPRRPLSLIHISEPTRPYSIPYAVFSLKKNTHTTHTHTQQHMKRVHIQEHTR